MMCFWGRATKNFEKKKIQEKNIFLGGEGGHLTIIFIVIRLTLRTQTSIFEKPKHVRWHLAFY
jgi:hypothetical protein